MDVTVQTPVPKLILLIVFWHQGNACSLSVSNWGGQNWGEVGRKKERERKKRSFSCFLGPALFCHVLIPEQLTS